MKANPRRSPSARRRTDPNSTCASRGRAAARRASTALRPGATPKAGRPVNPPSGCNFTPGRGGAGKRLTRSVRASPPELEGGPAERRLASRGTSLTGSPQPPASGSRPGPAAERASPRRRPNPASCRGRPVSQATRARPRAFAHHLAQHRLLERSDGAQENRHRLLAGQVRRRAQTVRLVIVGGRLRRCHALHEPRDVTRAYGEGAGVRGLCAPSKQPLSVGDAVSASACVAQAPNRIEMTSRFIVRFVGALNSSGSRDDSAFDRAS